MKSVILITVVMLISASVGAGIGWLNNNRVLVRDVLAIIAPGLTARIETAATIESYERSMHFAVCSEHYVLARKDSNQQQRDTACECYDRAVSQWSPKTQSASAMAVHTVHMPQRHLANNRDFYDPVSGNPTGAINRISTAISNNSTWTAQAKALETAGPVDGMTLAQTSDRVEQLLNQCGVWKVPARPRTPGQLDEYWQNVPFGANS